MDRVIELLISLAVSFVFGYFIGKMAEKKRYDFTTWFLFGTFLALPAYLIIVMREPLPPPSQQGTMACPKCGQEITRASKLCRFCKTRIKESDRVASLELDPPEMSS